MPPSPPFLDSVGGWLGDRLSAQETPTNLQSGKIASIDIGVMCGGVHIQQKTII